MTDAVDDEGTTSPASEVEKHSRSGCSSFCVIFVETTAFKTSFCAFKCINHLGQISDSTTVFVAFSCIDDHEVVNVVMISVYPACVYSIV